MTVVYRMPRHGGTKGFSLVELSIVLVILGLLVGGILAGQSLIRASELRSISAEAQRFTTAGMAFRDKYFAIPGDMANATSVWGSIGGNGADSTCGAAPSTDARTCNGDGNGMVDAINGGGVREQFRFWQHLANAGLIEGRYCGANGTLCGSTINNAPGVNIPGSKFSSSAAWRAVYSTAVTASTTVFARPAAHMLFLIDSSGGNQVLSPETIWNIDTKLDDGLPGTGTLQSDKGNGTTTFCSTAAGVNAPGDAGARYNLSYTGRDCVPYLLNPF